MKKAYLSISFQNRHHLDSEIKTIREVLKSFDFDLFIFVDSFQFSKYEEKEMMQQAFTEISSADVLIAEVSEKAIGVGIEIGYAVAINKPVIFMRHSLADHSTTASGSANFTIVYQNLSVLENQLSYILLKMNR